MCIECKAIALVHAIDLHWRSIEAALASHAAATGQMPNVYPILVASRELKSAVAQPTQDAKEKDHG